MTTAAKHFLEDRTQRHELMDQPGLDEKLHAHALRSLSRVNWISRTSAVIWRPIKKLAEESLGSAFG